MMNFKDQKIKVKGKIQLGSELNLVRKLDSGNEKERFTVRVRPSRRINPASARLPRDYSGIGVNEKKFEFVLEKGPGQVFIKDQGFCQSYGIFGVPGCGKTFLLMHLLDQILSHEAKDNDKKIGGLLLDPKGALIGDVIEMVEKAGRKKDLIIINDNYMKHYEEEINAIHSYLKPYDKGMALALAAKSAGVDSKEQYWMNNLALLFGAGLQLLELKSREFKSLPTLKDLAILFIDSTKVGEKDDPQYHENLKLLINLIENSLDTFTEEEKEKFFSAKSTLENYLDEQSKDKPVMKSFFNMGFGIFRFQENVMFSQQIAPSEATKSIYDAIIEEGKIVLVSVSKRSLAISKILCTIIKTLFQNTVITRFDRYYSEELTNCTRPLLFLADEYSDVATELDGHPMGDSMFFSQMRQYGCMGLVATQNVHMLENSGLKKAWPAVFGNLSAKIFMQLGDTATAEEASKLVGKSEFLFKTFDMTYSKDGMSQSVKSEIKEKNDLPTRVLLQTLGRGQAVVVGSMDSLETRPGCWFIHVKGDNWKPTKN
ncbi:type IV secretion system DNA-binding domain-containing protein [Nitrospira sp. T9]|uniref:type IV secretion system DNA-binding domain-containing protein n=1 Tax=unclassified Nitrospira TaxID=2652172 RepID=UPI003F9B9D92